jgi:tetraacyldisaccharide 4'-kinase
LVGVMQERYGLKCAVVLRGYKRASSGQLIVRDWNEIRANSRRSGDEAALYARELPNTVVICDASRVSGARMAREMGAEVIVLDDGFQHLRLRRDLNIVLINALEGIPNVIPFGKGREVRAALSAVSVLVVTNDSDEAVLLRHSLEKQLPGKTVSATTQITKLRPLGDRSPSSVGHDLSGRKVLAVSGIGTPQGFEEALRPLVRDFVALRFSDHKDYTASDLERIYATAATSSCEVIVTTTKDEVKLARLVAATGELPPFVVAESELIVGDNKHVLVSALDTLFSSRRA